MMNDVNVLNAHRAEIATPCTIRECEVAEEVGEERIGRGVGGARDIVVLLRSQRFRDDDLL